MPLRLENVTAGPLKNVSIRVDAGQIVCVWCQSKASRLALLDVAAGVLPTSAGIVSRDGRVLLAQRSWPELGGRDVLGQLMLPLLATRSLTAARAVALGVLVEWKVEGWATARLDELEEHEKARLYVIRALATDPDVLLIDDPVFGLDPVHADSLIDPLRVAARERNTAVLVASATIDPMRDADGTYTLEQGTIRGSHRDLGTLLPFQRRA